MATSVPCRENQTAIMGPQAGVVEAGGFSESVVAPAMSIAGQVVEEFEFAKDGEISVGAEGLLEFRQSSDFVAQQVLAKDLGIEGEGSHNCRITRQLAGAPSRSGCC